MALRDQKHGLSATEQEDAKAYLEDSEGSVAHVSLTLDPPAALLTVDGLGLVPCESEPLTYRVQVESPWMGASLRLSSFSLVLDPGMHLLRAAREGYENALVSRSYRAGENSALDLHLDQLTSRVMISSEPSDAVVSLDGHVAGSTPILLERPAGVYGVQVARQHFETYAATFTLTAGQYLNLTAELRPDRRDPYVWGREHWQLLVGLTIFAVLVLAILVAYLAFPLFIYRVYARLPLSDSFKSMPPYVSGPLGVLLVIPAVARSSRVVDAWIRKYRERLSAKDMRPARFSALPVCSGADEVRFTDPAKARFLFVHASPGQAARTILIRGPGGTGKTTLLRRILAWIQEGLLDHPAIALVVESDEDPILTSTTVLDGISVRLSTSADPEWPVPPGFIRALLSSGRLVLAFDHVSELATASQTRIKSLRDRLAVKHVLMTSRTRIELRHSDTLELEPALLGPAELPDFVRDLLPVSEFTDTAFAADVTKRMALFLRGELEGERGAVPALVVWLFVKACEKDKFDPFAMPKSILALYFDYARYHATTVAPANVARALGAVRALAREAVSYSGTIGAVSRKRAAELFESLGPRGADSVQLLVDSGLLAEVSAGTEDYVRFALDPLAEHLAMEDLALKTHEKAKGALEVWQRVVMDLASSSELQSTFRHIIRTYGVAHGFPDARTIFQPKVFTP